MALTAYIAATNRLLQNPLPANPLYSTADLTVYINEARQQLAGDAECVRANSTKAIVVSQWQYPFSFFTAFTSGNATLTGISSVLTIRELTIQDTDTGAFYSVYGRPWEYFQRYFINTGAFSISPGRPLHWAQQGRGAFGTFSVSPVPVLDNAFVADVCCLPVDLVDDTTPEAIPAPFTTAIPYYAAYKAYLSSQKTQDATTMLGRYEQFVKRAVEESTPTRFPGNFPGGRGAAIAAAKQSLTESSKGGQQ